MRTLVTPSGLVKSVTSEYWGRVVARFMNSAQMGAAVSAPWRRWVRPVEMSV